MVSSRARSRSWRTADGCPAVYDQDELPSFELQISDAEWAALQADYSYGTKAWHPAVFTGTLSGETVTMADAAVRLSGNPGFSWIGPKMQFAISFTQTDPDARYNGLRKLKVPSRGRNPDAHRLPSRPQTPERRSRVRRLRLVTTDGHHVPIQPRDVNPRATPCTPPRRSHGTAVGTYLSH